MKKMLVLWILLIMVIISVAAQRAHVEEGVGTWYNTQNATPLASHAQLPFGTKLEVTNLENGKSVILKIGGRIDRKLGVLLDIASPIADQLQMNRTGTTRLRIEVIPPNTKTLVNRSVDRKLIQEGIAMRMDDGTQLTVGHSVLPEGSRVRVTNLANGKTASATVLYRIRASRTRVLEISDALGQRLEITDFGNVRVESLEE
jgi:rare lipoprotein A (peptidoglycan hydrolase)